MIEKDTTTNTPIFAPSNLWQSPITTYQNADKRLNQFMPFRSALQTRQRRRRCHAAA
jgi:hypothetical protein